MSIIRDVILSLEAVITTSTLIVEVEVIEAYEELIPVPTNDVSKPIPDFIKRGFIFKVKRILKNTTGHSVPDSIRVPNENWKRFFSQHKELYANGPSKSFAVNTYPTKIPSMKEADILFLNHFQDAFMLTAKNSFESLAAYKTIIAHIV